MEKTELTVQKTDTSSYRLCLIGNFLSSAGHTPQICETLSGTFSSQGQEVIRAGRFQSRFLRFLDMTVTPVLERNNFDVFIIDTFSGPSFRWAWLCGKMARVLGKPYIPLLHGGNLPIFYNRQKKKVARYFKHAACIISPSHYLKQWVESLGYSAEVIPNPLDFSNYTFRKRSSPTPKLFWLRRFHEIYNPQMAIRVLDSVKKKFPDASLIMAGPDSGAQAGCLELVKQYGLSDSVEFTGMLSKNEINVYGGKCDIFINTSQMDNIPVTLIEAAAMGLPIVSTNPGGISTLFEHEKEALLVPLENTEGMASAIERLLNEPGLAERISAKAFNKIRCHTWDKIWPKWKRVFEQVLNSFQSI